MAAAAARRAQGMIRPPTTALLPAPLPPRREISMVAEAAREGVRTSAGRAWLKEQRDPIRFQTRRKTTSASGDATPPPVPMPGEGSGWGYKMLKERVRKVETEMIEFKVKLRHTQAGYCWSMFFGFTTALTVLPSWVYYLQLDSSTTKEDNKKLAARIDKLEKEIADPKMSTKLEVEVKFPRDES